MDRLTSKRDFYIIIMVIKMNEFSLKCVVDKLCDDAKRIFDIDYRHTVTSTNTLLKEDALNGKKAGSVLVASCQTNGRGRLGREFVSPCDNGLYMSVILKPEVCAQKALLITTSCAVMVARAIKRLTGKSPLIKWVNDLYLDNKKICGILAEGTINSEGTGFDSVILGIGVNLLPPAKSGELSDIAGGIFEKVENMPQDFINLLCAEILNEISLYFTSPDIFESGLIDEYRRLSFMLGKDIYIVSPTEKTKAVALDIADNGGMIVCLEDGTQKNITSNEISLRINND